MRSFGFLVAFYCEEGKEEALNEEQQRFSQLSRRPAPLRKIKRCCTGCTVINRGYVNCVDTEIVTSFLLGQFSI